MLAQSRIFYTMANDGLLPPWVGRLHPRFRTPHLITIVTGLVMAMLAAVRPIGVLGELVSMGTLLTFVIVCAGVIILRRTRPELPRPFRTPWSPRRAAARGGDVRLPDVGAAGRHVAAPRRLDGRRDPRVRRVRTPAQQGAARRRSRTLSVVGQLFRAASRQSFLEAELKLCPTCVAAVVGRLFKAASRRSFLEAELKCALSGDG